MSEDFLFAKTAGPDMTMVNFNNHFCDLIGEVDRGHLEAFPKLWNLRPYDKMNREITRFLRLIASYQNVRKENENWGQYTKRPEKIPKFPLIRRMLLGADSLVHTLRFKALKPTKGDGKVLRIDGPVLHRQKRCRAAVYAIFICG